MQEDKYCYPGTDILINKFGIKDAKKLFYVERYFVSCRLLELQEKPISGNYNFEHLKNIHSYIFQDVYNWSGKERTVELSKDGSSFCSLVNLHSFASHIFKKYFSQCWSAKDDHAAFVKALANNYGDLNALHPFREGNWRSQREFARNVCLKCGYSFNLFCVTNRMMLEASIASFMTGDSTKFEHIFAKAVRKGFSCDDGVISIFSSDDLLLGPNEASLENEDDCLPTDNIIPHDFDSNNSPSP